MSSLFRPYSDFTTALGVGVGVGVGTGSGVGAGTGVGAGVGDAVPHHSIQLYNFNTVVS